MFPRQAQRPLPPAPASFRPAGGADLPPTPAATLASPSAFLAFSVEASRTY